MILVFSVCNLRVTICNNTFLGGAWQFIYFLICLVCLICQEGVAVRSTMGVVVIDGVPNVGTFFEGFLQVSQHKNVAMHYCPIFTDTEHCDWFSAFWNQELVNMFQKGEFSFAGVERPWFANHFGSFPPQWY